MEVTISRACRQQNLPQQELWSHPPASSLSVLWAFDPRHEGSHGKCTAEQVTTAQVSGQRDENGESGELEITGETTEVGGPQE